jgi:hypothetical protein
VFIRLFIAMSKYQTKQLKKRKDLSWLMVSVHGWAAPLFLGLVRLSIMAGGAGREWPLGSRETQGKIQPLRTCS